MSKRKLMWKQIQSIAANATNETFLVLHVDECQQGPRDKSDAGSANFRRLVEEAELMEMKTGRGAFHLDQWSYRSTTL